MKQNLMDKCVQNQVVWGHACGKKWPVALKVGQNGQNISVFKSTTQTKLSKKKQNASKKQSAKDLSVSFSICNIHAIGNPREETIYVKKGQKSWTDEFSSVLKILLQKNIEGSSDHNRNFDCDKTESPRSACANYRQFGVLYAEERPII